MMENKEQLFNLSFEELEAGAKKRKLELNKEIEQLENALQAPNDQVKATITRKRKEEFAIESWMKMRGYMVSKIHGDFHSVMNAAQAKEKIEAARKEIEALEMTVVAINEIIVGLSKRATRKIATLESNEMEAIEGIVMRQIGIELVEQQIFETNPSVPTSKARFSEVLEVPRSQITLAPELFQGRQTEFSIETVAKIVAEGYDKSQEPIVLWENPESDLILISGHSRFEASIQLYEHGDHSLVSLPAKFFLGNEEEAMAYALLESNRSGTQEGLLSDLSAYKMATEKGYNKNYLKHLFKPESHLRLLGELSSLNPKGLFLEYLAGDSQMHFPYLKRNATWVGSMRRGEPRLTNAHEEELFFYLYPTDSGSKKRLDITKDSFFDKVNRKVNRIDFDPQKPLNLNDHVSTDAFTDPVTKQIRELEAEIAALDRERKQKDERIAKAKTQGRQDLVEKHQQRSTEITALIARILTEKTELEKQIGHINRVMVSDLFSQGKPKAAPSPSPENLPTARPSIDLLGQGIWFEKHPAKILGEQVEKTNAWGKPETKVIGDKNQALDQIETRKVARAIREEETIVLSTDETALELAIAKSVAEQSREALERESGTASEGGELKGFDEVLTQLNPNISEGEIRVWVWHLWQQGSSGQKRAIENPQNGWLKYLSISSPHWIQDGLLCVDQSKMVPALLYYAGDILQKTSDLEASENEFISEWGQEVYQRQLDGLRAAMPQPLLLRPEDPARQLSISIESTFAAETLIGRLANGTEFTRFDPASGSHQPQKLSLPDAFVQWLRSLPTSEFFKVTLSQIEKHFVLNKRMSSRLERADQTRIKRVIQEKGHAFFKRFLSTALAAEDQHEIEQSWNRQFNSFVPVDYNKVPIAFAHSRTFRNKSFSLRNVQREAIGFVTERESGCLALDVGGGKTAAAICAMAQAMELGRCSRPLVVVPNSTYENWIAEIQGQAKGGKIVQTGILPQYQLNGLYNLSAPYLDEIRDENGQIDRVAPNSITILTYEGFQRLGFAQDTWDQMGDELFSILRNGGETNRQVQQLKEKIKTIMGVGKAGTTISLEELGFDFLVIDEAHSMKKSFTTVRGEQTADKREKQRYLLSSGEPSARALRGFMVAQYIQRHNTTRNVVLLTATPFTNSPLEIYSMLALIAYPELKKAGIHNLKTFFDLFVRLSNQLVLGADLSIKSKDVVMGFNNLSVLQRLIQRFIMFRSGLDLDIRRPHKITLPRIQEKVGDGLVDLEPEDRIETFLPFSPLQTQYMEMVQDYLSGNLDLFGEGPLAEEDPSKWLRGLAMADQISLSPFLFRFHTGAFPAAREYVEHSPKILFAVRCIESVRSHVVKKGVDMPGQLIYMARGVDYFPLIVEYLTRYSGFRPEEVAIISGQLEAREKEVIKNRFLSGEVKVLIGSPSVREGMNLQNKATDIYNLWPDWNPTDLRQLEGRIWRQGNQYANVRITMPLMENSADIFRFQKLQEKTSRINELWRKPSGENVLDLLDINPEELKYALVTDPDKVAELKVLEEKENLEEEIAFATSKKKYILLYFSEQEKYQKYFPEIERTVAAYNPSKRKGGRKVETILSIYANYLADQTTPTILNDHTRLKEVRKAIKTMHQLDQEILSPMGWAGLDKESILNQIENELLGLKKDFDNLAGLTALKAIAEQVRTQRKESDTTRHSIEKAIEGFASLNEIVVEELAFIPDKKAEAQARQEAQKLEKVLKEEMTIEQEIEAQSRELEALEELAQMEQELEQMKIS